MCSTADAEYSRLRGSIGGGCGSRIRVRRPISLIPEEQREAAEAVVSPLVASFLRVNVECSSVARWANRPKSEAPTQCSDISSSSTWKETRASLAVPMALHACRDGD